MSDEDVVVLDAIDDDPEEWHDEHPEATEEEMALGNKLGDEIEPDDDEDAG